MIASYQTIKRLKPIKAMKERTDRMGMTFGLSAAGYDIRIAETIRFEPNAFSLASSVEEFQMPDNLLGVVHDKSTWARQGLFVQNTVIEPGWRGFLTLELTAVNRIVIRRGSPIAQVVFHLLDEPTQRPYRGKYQDQKKGPQPAILDDHGVVI